MVIIIKIIIVIITINRIIKSIIINLNLINKYYNLVDIIYFKF